MSSILDALRKVEEEKAQAEQAAMQEVEADEAEHDLIVPASERLSLHFSPVTLGLFLGAFAVVLVSLSVWISISLTQGSDSGSQAVEAASTPIAPPPASTTPTPLQAAAPEQTAARDTPASSAITPVPRPADTQERAVPKEEAIAPPHNSTTTPAIPEPAPAPPRETKVLAKATPPPNVIVEPVEEAPPIVAESRSEPQSVQKTPSMASTEIGTRDAAVTARATPTEVRVARVEAGTARKPVMETPRPYVVGAKPNARAKPEVSSQLLKET